MSGSVNFNPKLNIFEYSKRNIYESIPSPELNKEKVTNIVSSKVVETLKVSPMETKPFRTIEHFTTKPLNVSPQKFNILKDSDNTSQSSSINTTPTPK